VRTQYAADPYNANRVVSRVTFVIRGRLAGHAMAVRRAIPGSMKNIAGCKMGRTFTIPTFAE
jgi:hypothetical protein